MSTQKPKSSIDWANVEQQVNNTEKKILETKFAAHAQVMQNVLGEEKTLPKTMIDTGEGSASFDYVAMEIKKLREQTEKIIDAIDMDEYEAENLLSQEGQLLASLRYKNLAKALRNLRAIDEDLAAINAQKAELYTFVNKDFRKDPLLSEDYKHLREKIVLDEYNLAQFNGTGEGRQKIVDTIAKDKKKAKELSLILTVDMRNNPTFVDKLQQLFAKEEAYKTLKKNLCNQNPEAFIGLHLKELRAYKRQLDQGGIVVTPYVQQVKEDIISHLRFSKPVFMSGHLGSGKTELAIHVAKEMTGKDPLIISGAEDTSLSELYGHQVLKTKEMDMSSFDTYNREVELKFEEWKESRGEALGKMTPEEQQHVMDQAHDRILQIYLKNFESSTTSGFLLGKVYQAMDEGRTLILDEVNAIPHEVLISLNHLLTRKPGETIYVQQYPGEKVVIKEGFGVIATGNLNTAAIGKVYIGRKELDLAWRNRFYEKDYDYLPQNDTGSSEEAKENDDQFHLLLTHLMTHEGALKIPEGGVRKIWNLAKAAKNFQNIFSGKRTAEIMDETTKQKIKVQLQQAVPSFRDLLSIVKAWKADNFIKELDYYVYREFLSKNFPPADKAMVYLFMQSFYDFFNSNGWTPKSEFVHSDQAKNFSIKVPENAEKKCELFTKRDTVEIAFGKAPERTVFPVLPEEAPEISAEVLEFLEGLQQDVEYIEGIIVKIDDKKAVGATAISSN